MPSDKIRRQVAWEAARLMYQREETEYFPAKLKAARRIAHGQFKPGDLPSNREIRDQVQAWARLHEGDGRTQNLRDMRLEALRLMRILRRFHPRLIGSTLTGHVRRGSDIDLHIFSDSVEAVAAVLDEEGFSYEVQRKRVRKQGEERIFVHIHIEDRFPFELTIYAADKAHYVFKSSITGKAIERASIAELEQFLAREYPDAALEQSVLVAESRVDRFQIYQMLLLPLENVKEDPRYHPEGDALYHSLQVFELARRELPYDEEFLLAALLHDVGKAIDRRDHVDRGPGGPGRPHHAADRLADRASHGGPGPAGRRPGRSCAAAIGSLRELRGTEAAGPLRPQRPPARLPDRRPGRGVGIPSRAGPDVRGMRPTAGNATRC